MSDEYVFKQAAIEAAYQGLQRPSNSDEWKRILEQINAIPSVEVEPVINGQNLFKRLVIRNLHPDLPEVLDLTEWFERMGEPLIVEEVQDG